MDQECPTEQSDVFNILPSKPFPGTSKCTKKNPKRENKRDEDFHIRNIKPSILNLKKVLMPSMKLGKRSVQELDDFSFHMLEIFQDELILLNKRKRKKTLSVRDLEAVIRLRFPKILGVSALEFGKKATLSRCKMELEPMNAEESDVSREELLPESSDEIQNVKGKMKKSPRRLNTRNFKTFILRKKNILMPEMKLGKLTLQEMDDFLTHMMGMSFEGIQTLQRKGKNKTLGVNDLETIISLCQPKTYGTVASDIGRNAVDNYFR